MNFYSVKIGFFFLPPQQKWNNLMAPVVKDVILSHMTITHVSEVDKKSTVDPNA